MFILPFRVQCLLYVPSSPSFKNSTLCLQISFLRFVWIPRETVTISLNSINGVTFIMKWSVFTARYGRIFGNN